MKKLTEKQKDTYLKNPVLCPYCKRHNITGIDIDYGYNEVWRTITCNSCKKSWIEIFTITDIEEAKLF